MKANGFRWAFVPLFAVVVVFAGWRGQHASPGSSVASGAQLYGAYCASCHGSAATGNGPVASTLQIAPPDLTVLARRNGGAYPEHQVIRSIEWGNALASHRPRQMPAWSVALRPLSRDNQKEVTAQIRQLTSYLGTLQVN